MFRIGLAALLLSGVSDSMSMGFGSLQIGMSNAEVKKILQLSCRPLHTTHWKGVTQSRVLCEAEPISGVKEATSRTLTFNENGRLVSIWMGFLSARTDESFRRLHEAVALPSCDPLRMHKISQREADYQCLYAPDVVLTVKWDSDGCRLHCKNVQKWQYWTISVARDKHEYAVALRSLRANLEKQRDNESLEVKKRKLEDKARAFSS